MAGGRLRTRTGELRTVTDTLTLPDATTQCARRARWGDFALLFARLIVGGLMIYVSIGKLQDPVAFLKVVKLYEIVPVEWHVALNSIAVIVPWVELLGGAALLVGVGLRGTGAVMFVMLIVFSMAITMRTLHIMDAEGKLFMQVKFDCGCGTGEQIIWLKLLENAGLILLALLITLSKSRFLCLSRWVCRAKAQKPLSEPQSS